MRIGILGLGSMGQPMARRLAQAGFSVIGFNRTRSRAEALSSDGVHVADTPGEACDVDLLITMVSDDDAIEHRLPDEDVLFLHRLILSGTPPVRRALVGHPSQSILAIPAHEIRYTGVLTPTLTRTAERARSTVDRAPRSVPPPGIHAVPHWMIGTHSPQSDVFVRGSLTGGRRTTHALDTATRSQDPD